MAIPTPMSKVIPVNLDFKNSSISNWKPFNTDMAFWTNDIGSAFLEFSTELNLIGTVVSIILENQYDNSLVQKTMTGINTSPFYYQLGDEIQHEGRWFVQISIKKGLETISSNSFAFMVNASVGHGKVARLVSIETFETLATQLTALHTIALADHASYEGLLTDGVLATNIENKLLYLETTYAPELNSVKQQLAEAKADLQVGMGALTADAEVVTARSSTVTGVVHTVLDNRLEAIETAESVMATNLVPNGDFTSGTTEWSPTAGTIRAESGQLVLNEGITNAEHYAQTDLSAPLLNNVYYFRGSSSNGAAISLYNRKSDGSYESVSRPFVGGVASGKITTTTVYATPGMFIRLYGRTGIYLGANIEYLFDNVAVLNLTAIFGTGSEPTTEQMDRLMSQFQNSWFGGTKNLFLAKSALKEMRRLDNDFVGHVVNVSNPHGVTKTQIGLSNVDNTSDLNKPISTLTQAAITAHTGNTTNPHAVTKVQVGLGNADNTSDANKPVSTATQTALNLKADKTTTDGLNTRLTAEETATAANKISAVKSNTFADVDARFEDVEFDTVLMATNKVVNGDFAGLTGWSALYAALSAANNVLSITGDGTNATPRVYQITTGKITANTKIYATQLVKVTNAVCSNITIELKSDPSLSALGVFGSVSSPAQNVAYRVSGIVQAPSGYDNNNIVLFVRNTYSDGATASGKVLQLSVPIVLNLTEIFGVGNEPTSAQMDRLLTQFPNSWFTGTENLFLAKWALNELRRLDNDKANKAQEAWITPTLVNGATGTFQYRKNEFGRLEFKGELTQASTASYFCITIAGYRPPAWIRCPITSIDGVVSMLIMSDGGALYLHTPLAGKIVSFSGISINIQ